MAANERAEVQRCQFQRSGRAGRNHLALALIAALVGLAWTLCQLLSPPTAVTLAAPFDASTPTLVPGAGAVVGTSWQDLNENAALDPGEPPLPGVLLTITSQDQVIKLATVSGVDGSYRFDALAPGLYTLSAAPPNGYELTSLASLPVFVSAGTVLSLNFGAKFVPTPTPSPTSTPTPTLEPQVDADNAVRAFCGGILQANTQDGQRNVNSYSCRPAWMESGPELVYRVEIGRPQPISASLITTTADLDLFLLTSASPESCVATGDNAFTYNAQPGNYYLVVDGYDGAVGSFALKLTCPLEPIQATATPTFAPSATPTASVTFTPGPTPTATATSTPFRLYLPLGLRTVVTSTPVPVELSFQQGVDGYLGTNDTTLNSWLPTGARGSEASLELFYARPPYTAIHPETQKAPILRFDLTLLPTMANVVTATLELYVPKAPDRDLRAETHALLRGWDEATATWAQPAAGQAWSVPGAQGAGTDYAEAATDNQHIQVDGTRWYTFDVTSMVREWVKTPLLNYGVILRAKAGDDPSNVGVAFASREYPTIALRPRLRITYGLSPSTASSAGR
jgi:hypothetical protein